MNGCYRYVVQAQKLGKEGKPVEDVSFDEHQLILIKSSRKLGTHETGGPRPHIRRM